MPVSRHHAEWIDRNFHSIERTFNDSNYFIRQFRKATGLSPREYRLRLGVE